MVHIDPISSPEHDSLVAKAYEKSLLAHNRSRQAYNSTRVSRSFIPQQTVLVRIHVLSSAAFRFNAKLAPRWELGVVLRQVSKNDYDIQC
jgi:hypothetical protein